MADAQTGITPNGFGVTEDRYNGTVALALAGELDIATIPQLQEVLDRARDEAPELTLDLRRLTFLDSSGLRIILTEHSRAQDAGRTMRIIRGPDAVHRVFELTGTTELLTFVDAPAAA